MKKCIRADDKAQVASIFHLSTIGSGPKTAVKPDERKALNKKIISAAEKGFALDNSS